MASRKENIKINDKENSLVSLLLHTVHDKINSSGLGKRWLLHALYNAHGRSNHSLKSYSIHVLDRVWALFCLLSLVKAAILYCSMIPGPDSIPKNVCKNCKESMKSLSPYFNELIE